MSDQNVTVPKEKVSLDDLKIMIDGYDRNRRDPDAHWHRAEAWSTAFEWYSQVVTPDGVRSPGELQKGMRLIRETLK